MTVDNARLFSHFACGWRPETLLLTRQIYHFPRKVSHLRPGSPYQTRLCHVYKRRQTYYKPCARSGTSLRLTTPPQRGAKAALCAFTAPGHHRNSSACPDCPPFGRSALSLAPRPPALRRYPCASIRARGARAPSSVIERHGLQEGGRLTPPIWASRIAARQADGSRRGEPVGGCGAPATKRAGAVHAPVGWASATVHGRARADRARSHISRSIPLAHAFHSTGRRSMSISNMQKSRRSLVRATCRTRGGLVVLGRNTDMRRHGVLRPKTTKPQPLRGRGA